MLQPPSIFFADEDTSWMDEAVCPQTDPEAFFPEVGEKPRQAKEICKGCPVIEQCLDYAIRKDFTIGVWGGTSSKARRPLHLAYREMVSQAEKAALADMESEQAA